MKSCSICHFEKDVSCFNKHSGKPDGLQTHCRECSKNKAKNYYQENKEHVKRNVRKRSKNYLEATRAFVLTVLLNSKCVDCGEKDPLVLEFDHIKGHKENAICKMVDNGTSIAKIKSEIEKCVTRCANCHRRKTAKDFKYWRYEWFSKVLREKIGF